MRPATHLALPLLALAGLSLVDGRAQTNPGPVTRAAPVVVEETPLNADAAGLTRVHLDATAPAPTLSLGALATRVANLHIDTGGAGSFGDIVTLRGLANTPYFSDPSVTLYFDDLPLGSSFTYPTALFGFASAAISRGPQGTALGRGGEGGAIVLTSAEPAEHAGGELRVSAGDFAARAAALSAASARTGAADVALAASFGERDGFIKNTQLGTRVDDQRSYAASARVRFRPTKAGEFSLQLLGCRHRDGAQPLVPLGGPRFTVARGREGSTDIDFGGAALKGAFDTAAGRLTSVTSCTEWRMNPYDNRLVLPPTLDSKVVQTQRAWNEELRLASDARSDVTWNGGLWWSATRTVGDVNRGLVIPTTVIPIEVSNYTLHSRTVALFGEMTFAPAADWRVTAGVRGEETKKDFDRGQRVPPPVARFTAHNTFDSFQPKLTARYALDADTNATASVAFGTKPGGWSAYTGVASLAPFAAEKALAFETGFDTAFAAKTVKLAARFFYYDIDNYQIERSFNAQDYLVVNAPRARSLGGELEATWRPLPEWTLAATLGVTDVTLRRFTDPFTGRSFAGNRAPYAPSYDASSSATWRPAAGWFVAAEIAAVGKTFFDESENPTFASAAHSIGNARLGYETARWRATLYGQNVTDEGYDALIIPGVRHAAPGAPRTWGVEVAVKW